MKQASAPRHIHTGTVYLVWKCKSPSQTAHRWNTRAPWTCNVICVSCLRDGLTDKLTPWRCISRMHAMSQMSHVIDRTLSSPSERSLLSIYSRREEGGDGTERLVSTWSHFGRIIFPSPPERVMSWVVVVGAHVTPCDIRPTQCCQSLTPRFISDTGPFQWAAATSLLKLVDIEWCVCLLRLIGVMLDMH